MAKPSRTRKDTKICLWKWQGGQPSQKTQGFFILETSRLKNNPNPNLWCQKERQKEGSYINWWAKISQDENRGRPLIFEQSVFNINKKKFSKAIEHALGWLIQLALCLADPPGPRDTGVNKAKVTVLSAPVLPLEGGDRQPSKWAK